MCRMMWSSWGVGDLVDKAFAQETDALLNLGASSNNFPRERGKRNAMMGLSTAPDLHARLQDPAKDIFEVVVRDIPKTVGRHSWPARGER
jgi:hypothetical protein